MGRLLFAMSQVTSVSVPVLPNAHMLLLITVISDSHAPVGDPVGSQDQPAPES